MTWQAFAYTLVKPLFYFPIISFHGRMGSFFPDMSATAYCYKKSECNPKYLDGQEYGLDVINDLKHSYALKIIKEKVEIRSNETFIGKTVNNNDFASLS